MAIAEVAIDLFKSTFSINTNTSDIKFLRVQEEPYNTLEQKHEFGEKVCVLHTVSLSIFNIEVNLRILCFKYDDHVEVLKLEINVPNDSFSREVAPCKNFLQRKRNMNLTFELLIKFAKLFEMRRLICWTVFKKYPLIIVTENEAGIAVKCYTANFNRNLLDFNWTINWIVEECEVSDFIEFYLNNSVLSKRRRGKVREKLEVIVQPHIDFHTKLKLWKSVLENLYSRPSAPTTDILEISSDEDDSVIEIS
ncbi:uncharacterized protein LOC103313636 [Tribolium castaneum]|uniref:Uncharacterized protein n=1 Tax=Tribolium castaneum TaxID=7070 RepID=A0A139WE92_TRICA|nr:PREDICTED: uncharacterized protein LOC103313636 [Tribolium castaneum]KYB26298.1 hypothetical protein TcasGA2_TC034794 [Tribolium castaneum]|eukprot:XP_008195636.1 PREDICTED: uncharacterized protein LOC103313636 [Tribolium castaneum]